METLGLIFLFLIGCVIAIVVWIICKQIWSAIKWRIEFKQTEFIGNQIIGDSRWFTEFPEAQLVLKKLGEQLVELKYTHPESIRELLRTRKYL